jgi:hypothetical protein
MNRSQEFTDFRRLYDGGVVPRDYWSERTPQIDS